MPVKLTCQSKHSLLFIRLLLKSSRSMEANMAQKRKRTKRLIFRKNLTGLLFLSPWIVGFLVFFLYPLCQSVIYSLNKVKITAKGRSLTFVKMENFVDIFTRDAYFVDRLVNFFKSILMELPLVLVFSMVIALLLNQRIKARGFFRTMFFLPIVVVSGPVLNMLLNEGSATIPLIEQYGLFEILSEILPYFLVEPVTTLFSQLLLILWYSGVPILIFLAGLQKIDISMYEAAYIDRASSWVVFWRIVLPSLKGMVLINAVYVVVFLATSEINEVIILIRANMLDANKGFGVASAMAWIYSIGIALLLGICYFLFGRTEKEKKEARRLA